MNINRNNYEEFFLLYADKELSADEKELVELFVKQNSDLEEEFIMLQQSVLKPGDAVYLENKNTLYRNTFIGEKNYEEKFLLYTDNELTLSEIEETEKFVERHPSLQHEFAVLQQVKFQPDTSIVFPDKNILYKKKSDAVIISLRWKALAAAILLGIGLWTGINYLSLRTGHTGGQKDTPQKITANKSSVKIKGDNPVIKPHDTTNDKNVAKDEIIRQKQSLPDEQKKVNNATAIQKESYAVNNNTKDKPAIKTLLQEKNNESIAVKEPPAINVNRVTNQLPQPLNRTEEPTDKTVSTPVIQNSDVIPASYIADEEVKSENYVFYNITTEEFKKSKIGNFLKRVKRSIERKLPFKSKGLKMGSAAIDKDTN